MTTSILTPRVNEEEVQEPVRRRTPAWVAYIRDARGRRPATLVLITTLAALFVYGGSATTSARPGGNAIAEATNCVYHGVRYHLVTDDVVGMRYGEAEFGASVCMDSSANVTSVIPTFGGNIEGKGTTFGFSWTPVSTKVDYHGQYAHVHSVAKAKMCLPFRGSPLCALTDTQDFDLVVITTFGPYVGVKPHNTAHSQTQDAMGGTAPMTRFDAF